MDEKLKAFVSAIEDGNALKMQSSSRKAYCIKYGGDHREMDEAEALMSDARNFDKKAEQLAEEYVDENPEYFAAFEEYAKPERQDDLVRLISFMRKGGFEEEVWKLTAFELARFERKHIGAQVQTRLKVRNGGRS